MLRSKLPSNIKSKGKFYSANDDDEKEFYNDFINSISNSTSLFYASLWDIDKEARTNEHEGKNNSTIWEPLSKCVKDVSKELPKGYKVTFDGGDWDDILIDIVYSDSIKESLVLQEAEKEEDFIHSSFVKESEWKSKYRSKFISVYKDTISKLKNFDKQMPNNNVLNYPDKDPEDWPSNIMIKYMDNFKGGPNDRQSGICTKCLTICELNDKSIPVFKRKTIRESLEKLLDSCIPSDLTKDNTKKMYFFIHGSGNKYTLIANSIIMNESASLQEFSRASIPASEFGVPSKKKFPLDSASHVKSAIRFFNYVDTEDEAELAKRIKEKAKKFGVAIRCGKKNRLSKYITKEYVNEFMAAGAIGNDAYAVINGSIKQAAYQNGYKYIEDDEYPYTKKRKANKEIHKNTMMNNDFTNKE